MLTLWRCRPVPLPKVHVFALGGTIAMTRADAGEGVRPQLTAEALVASVPQLADIARIEAASFRQLPSAHLHLDDVIALAEAIEQAVAQGAHGVVVTQGTDTIEETAFALDLLLGFEAPVVVTGAMRNPDLPGADGPANLAAAVRAAASDAARGLGTIVVMNDEIHAARFVKKAHTSSPAAFRSPLVGPIGWIAEDRVRIALRPHRHAPIAVPAEQPDVPVALLTASLGDDGRLLDALPSLGFRGCVLEGMGAGHVPAHMLPRLEQLAQRMPVVLASRTGSGETFRKTYGFPGSELDLLQKGLIAAGMLDGPKARVALALLLRAGTDKEGIAAFFDGLMA